MKLADLEVRIKRLEETVTRLAENRPAAPSKNINAWIDEIHGTFQDDAAYREAAHLGRKWRDSFRPRASRRRKASAK